MHIDKQRQRAMLYAGIADEAFPKSRQEIEQCDLEHARRPHFSMMTLLCDMEHIHKKSERPPLPGIIMVA